MGYNVNHPIVRDGLVFAVDAGYNLSYDGRENLANNSTYNATTWTLPGGNATITTGIDAPDGTNTAIRFTGGNAAESILRMTHPSVTPSGTASYTVSFFVRWISGSNASNGISSDWTDASPSGNYQSSLVAGTWVRITQTATAAASARTFLDLISNTTTNYIIDFWGVQIEQSSTATTYTPTTGSVITRGTTWNNLNTSISNGEFVGSRIFNSSNIGHFEFNGVSNYVRIPNSTALDTQTPTVEVWVKTNATNQAGFWFEKGEVNAQYSLFQEGGSILWRMNIEGITQLSASTSSFMNVTNWAHVVATYVSGFRALYINGVLVNSDTQTGTIATNASGMSIGVYGGYTGSRGYYYNGSLAICRVYNKALTPSEVAQNFAAHRGRFGV